MKHLLVEFQDGSLQWIKNTSEAEVIRVKQFKRIKSESFGEFYFTKKRWKESKESQLKIVVLD
jgi:hypothetical protein